MESITVELPSGLVDRLKRHARDNETTISELMIEALSGFLQRENK
ncbi:MAG: ribbon-helix-helix protein, CopG family [Desulfarculaceae bacterium]|nr:ribbon-helix-helix protein, CopG family [Desulfarculaceae bacterium]